MNTLRISGGPVLQGTVAASGSKNAALPIMAASILASGPVELVGVPDLTDVNTLALLLGHLGVEVKRGRDNIVRLATVDASPSRAAFNLVRRMRASFCVLGPLVARRGRGVVSLPGGCNIGPRPVDLHLAGLAALGADIRLAHGYVIATARRLRGATIDLSGPHGPTVTGTANVMSAATLALGQTILTGAAIEPEIVDLGRFLNALGARIEGLGTSTIEITGVEALGGTRYRIIPDRIEAATLLLAAVITQGEATVRGVDVSHLGSVLVALADSGCDVTASAGAVHVKAGARPRPIEIHAAPYPGIPTDLQAQFMALATLCDGTSRVTDRVFPERFAHVAELQRMGARIELRDATAVIRGTGQLAGAEVIASDLRASAALVLAGLAARGQTIVRRTQHLDRGYERLDEKLATLGARISRDRDQESAPRVVRGSS